MKTQKPDRDIHFWSKWDSSSKTVKSNLSFPLKRHTMGTSLVVQWIGIHFARARACAGSDQKGQLKAPKQKPCRQALQSIPYRQLQVVSSRGASGDALGG